jgi:hypothetical protein
MVSFKYHATYLSFPSTWYLWHWIVSILESSLMILFFMPRFSLRRPTRIDMILCGWQITPNVQAVLALLWPLVQANVTVQTLWPFEIYNTGKGAAIIENWRSTYLIRDAMIVYMPAYIDRSIVLRWYWLRYRYHGRWIRILSFTVATTYCHLVKFLFEYYIRMKRVSIGFLPL